MIKNKKGELDLEKVLPYLVVIIIVIGILGYVTFSFFGPWIKSKGEVEGCRTSVIVAAQATKLTKEAVPLDLECPRRDVKIYDDDYTLAGRKKQYAKEDYATNVKEVFAQQMAECWYKMGAGELHPFFEDPYFANFDDICLVCSHVEFTQAPRTTVGNLLDYIQEEQMGFVAAQGVAVTYYDYMHRVYKEGECYPDTETGNIAVTDLGEIYTNKSYDIIYKSRSYGALMGKLEVNYNCEFIVVGPTETLDDVGCDYIYS